MKLLHEDNVRIHNVTMKGIKAAQRIDGGKLVFNVSVGDLAEELPEPLVFIHVCVAGDEGDRECLGSLDDPLPLEMDFDLAITSGLFFKILRNQRVEEGFPPQGPILDRVMENILAHDATLEIEARSEGIYFTFTSGPYRSHGTENYKWIRHWIVPE